MLDQNEEVYNSILKEAIKKMNNVDKRLIIAKLVKLSGKGNQFHIAKEFNIGRDTIRIGLHELSTGIRCENACNLRGRKKAIVKIDSLKKDIVDIVEPHTQTDPTFKSNRLYTRISAKFIRNELLKKGYSENSIPCNQTIINILNELGYKLRKVLKAKPLNKIPETDEIFEMLTKIHEEAEKSDEVARLSIDCKDRIKIGDFSRGGKSRTGIKACDHDFSKEYITPFGILDVKNGELNLSLTKGPVTADFMVDRIREFWKDNEYDKTKKILILNADNGPENNSRRTQFMKRIIEFCLEFEVLVILAYYPPYHSKYNKIERVWGILEQHINGDVMDCEETVLEFCKTMTWKQKNPSVELIKKVYSTGKRLLPRQMEFIETMIDRVKGIGKWLVIIKPSKCKNIMTPIRI